MLSAVSQSGSLRKQRAGRSPTDMRTQAIFLLFGVTSLARGTGGTDWPEYLGDAGRRHFSPLTEIDVRNVAQLKLAWEYHTGEPGEMQCNPVVADGVLYGVTAT